MSDTTIDHRVWGFDPTTRTLTVGETPCACVSWRDGSFAGRAYRFTWVDCSKCRGTGKRGGGKCRECKYHRPSEYASGPDTRVGYYPGAVPDYANPLDDGVCSRCDGSLMVAGDGNASIPSGLLADLLATTPVTVTATGGSMGRVAQLIGFSEVRNDAVHARAYWTWGDYGRRFEDLRRANDAGALTEAIDTLRAEVAASLRTNDRSVCNWCLSEVAPRYSGTWLWPHRIVAVVGPDGVRVMAVRDNESE